MELDRFDGEIVWGSNRCSLLFERVKWRPRFYVAVDERVVPDTAREIAHLQQQLPDTRFFFPIHFRLRGTLGTTPNTTWYWQMPLREGRGAWGQFSRDPSRGVFEVRSVTVAALQLAVHLGFDPIYLFGCDTSYSVPASVRRDDGDPNGLTSTRDDDANHFDPAYFGAGRQWHEPHVDRMIEHYEFAKEACDELGVSVFNATVGGNLEVFPRVDYRDLV